MRRIDVTVAVLTFRRPEQLLVGISAILAELRTFVGPQQESHAGRILVVDNDPEASARDTVLSLGVDEIVYVVEQQAGIAAARNRALRESTGSDIVVFIDDDETPRPGWLNGLINTWSEHRSTAVAGRVVPVFAGDVPRWVEDGRFFHRRTLPTGTAVAAAAAGNLLIDVAQLRRLDVRFDDRLGLGGGEDTLLTRQVVERGGRIVWCDESVVEDHVPVDRATVRWVLTRAWSHGNTSAVVELIMAASTARRLTVRTKALTGGLARIAGGSARAVGGFLVRSNHHSARGLRTAFRGAGIAAAALGLTYREYARPTVGATSDQEARPDDRGGLT
jgi:uncharacterized metal-binding protein